MSKLIMLIGLSGSGKSTYANKKLEEGFTVWSSDNLRATLCGDEKDRSRNAEIFDFLHKGIIKDLKDGRDCIYDATCLSSKRRINFLKQVPKDTIKICVVFATPIWVCIERDRKRERTVGEKVIWKQCAQFQMPYIGEGWDKIEIAQYDGPLYWELAPLLNGSTPHESKWHKETIEEHMLSCWAEARADERPFYMLEALAYHDIGKLYTKTVGEDGFAHYYNHENVSAYLYLTQTSFKFNERHIKTLYLIQYHMEKLHRSEESFDKFLSRFPRDFGEDLELMNYYDNYCRKA